MKNQRPRLWWVILAFAVVGVPLAAEPLTIDIGLVSRVPEMRIPLSALEPRIQDDGVAGAEQGIRDNNATGRFTDQQFRLHAVLLGSHDDALAALRALRAKGARLFLVNLPAEELLSLAGTAEARDSFLFNIGARDDRLREQECRPNLVHTIPSRAMQADALAQYLAWKRWTKWFLVVGRDPGSRAYAQALERAAKRFGSKIVDRKEWTFKVGAKRTDSGHFNEQQEVNAFTQVGDYDILIVADELDGFGEYLSYRTYRPRPVGGTHGLISTPWSGVLEQWGATQFQRRFRKQMGRWMTSLDYAAWLAVRSIGESATRTASSDPSVLRTYMLSSEFNLAAFKGVPLTFRDWNGQMRQPLLLVSTRVLVSVSPQPGFLHQFSALDTLGYDRAEVRCKEG